MNASSHKKSVSLFFDYQIRRSQRARKTRIVVTDKKIEVVAPFKVSEQLIHDFVYSQQDWIHATLKKIQHRVENAKSMAPSSYHNGADIPFKGRQIQMNIKQVDSQKVSIELRQNSGFIIHLPKQSNTDYNELIRSTLTDWMKKQAHQDASHYVHKHADKYQLFPRSINIKTQKSRWGSCGIHNDIYLNWLLILAPPEVMEYVVVHELCHIRHRNHSSDFWQLVGNHMVNYQQHRHWLKQHGQSLMFGL